MVPFNIPACTIQNKLLQQKEKNYVNVKLLFVKGFTFTLRNQKNLPVKALRKAAILV